MKEAVMSKFPGFYDVQNVFKLEMILPELCEKIRSYRVIHQVGVIEDPSQDPNLSKETVTKLF